MKLLKLGSIWRLLAKTQILLLVLLSLAIIFLLSNDAQAAPLNYTSDTYVFLNSPAVTFTIKSGSVADTVTVNSGNIVVTMSGTTGGSFTLTSASTDLNTSGSGSNPLIWGKSCFSGTASTTISQPYGSATYTITPTASQCSQPPVSTGGSGGGGGGGGAGVVTTCINGLPCPTSSVAPTSTQPYQTIQPQQGSGTFLTQNQKALLLAAITIYLKNSSASPTTTSLILSAIQTLVNQTPALVPPPAEKIVFASHLEFGYKDNQVRLLQQLLARYPDIYPEGLATGYFGPLTRVAVEKFQEKYGIVGPGNPGYGTVGPNTRKKLNELW